MPAAPHPTGAMQGDCDVFLHVQTKRAGKIKGEARGRGHDDDIVVHGWRWGLSVSTAVGSARATSQRSYTALTVDKQIDSATTALMSALATNDEVKELTLAMRRAGGEQEDYFTIKLKAGRISSLQHEADAEGRTVETVTVAFTQVELEYRPQGTSGRRGGAFSFWDELPSSS